MGQTSNVNRAERAARDELIVKRREAGATLAEIAREVGVTRERVRQILLLRQIPPRRSFDTHRMRREQLLVRRDEIRQRFKEVLDDRAVSAELGVPRTLVRELTRDIVRDLHFQHRKKRARDYTDEQLIRHLQQVGGTRAGVATFAIYERERLKNIGSRKWPSAQTISLRFGSWPDALARSGLPSNPHGPKYGRVLYTDSECLEALREVAAAVGTSPTQQQYREHLTRVQRRVPGASTIRRRFGSWIDALRAAGLI